MAPDGTGVKNCNYKSLVQPPINIPPNITHLTSIYKDDVEYCQEFLLVGKYFIMFLKDKLEHQEEVDPGGASHLIFVAHNGFLPTFLNDSTEQKF